jgi:hypothetical protein
MNNETKQAILMISREFQFSKADWLEMSILCLDASQLIEDSVTLEITRRSLELAHKWRQEEEMAS